jgi:hypothetical protein
VNGLDVTTSKRGWRRLRHKVRKALGRIQLEQIISMLHEIVRMISAAANQNSAAANQNSAAANQNFTAIQGLAERFDELLRSHQELRSRLEFVRLEPLYEFKYGKGAGTSSAHGHTTEVKEPRILQPEKFERLKNSGLRLNLGCGHIALADYINVDQRDVPGVDVIAGIDDLPIPDGSVGEIYSAHLLEHFPNEQLRRRLLPYWYRLLSPQGRFGAVVPDGQAMLGGIASGTYAFEEFREVLFGGQEYDGDFHFNFFTPESLQQLLEEAGFTDISVPVRGRRNGKCFEFEIRAKRP